MTFDDDVARLVRDAQQRERTSLTQVVNEGLRRGLAKTGPEAAPYVVRVQHSAVRPGMEVTALNRLADEFEDDAFTSADS